MEISRAFFIKTLKNILDEAPPEFWEDAEGEIKSKLTGRELTKALIKEGVDNRAIISFVSSIMRQPALDERSVISDKDTHWVYSPELPVSSIGNIIIELHSGELHLGSYRDNVQEFIILGFLVCRPKEVRRWLTLPLK